MSNPLRRWVVERNGLELDAWLAQAGAEAQAAHGAGRLFVNGVRAVAGRGVLAAGDVIELFAARATLDEGAVHVLAEHDGFVAVYKPPLLATEPDRSGTGVTLLSESARLLGCSAAALHAVSRLDVGVSGVVLLARAAAPRLELEAHERRYLAIACAAPEPPAGRWTAPIDTRGRGRQNAETRYTTLALATQTVIAQLGRERRPFRAALLVLEPVTGRTHQLRIHCALAGASLLGDRAHGGIVRFSGAEGAVVECERIALHAVRVCWTARGRERCAEVAPPADFRALWRAVSGNDADLVNP